MRILIEKKEFAGGVHNASRFAQKGTATLPVLSAILIVAGNDGIKLRATNLETGVDLTLKGEAKEDGVVALPSSLITPLAASLIGEGTLTLEHTGDIATITTNNGKSILKTLPYEDFPHLPFPESKQKLKIAGTVLKQLLSSLSSCASHSTVRPELASVYLAIEGGTLTAVATDSFRLAEKKVPLTKSVPAAKILIPAKNAVDIAQILPDSDVELSFDEHQCTFSWEGGRVVTRLTNASYPDYKQIIPKETTTEATILSKDLEGALRRSTIFSDQFQKIRLEFDQKKKSLILYARNPDFGESSETIPASITGGPLELSFNHRYLASVFSLTTSESITLSAAGIGRPLTMRGAGDTSFLYLVSPMNQ